MRFCELLVGPCTAGATSERVGDTPGAAASKLVGPGRAAPASNRVGAAVIPASVSH